jgi:hypothetical protein
MTSHLEFSARAALCRHLAGREPDSKDLWLAEAERWSRLTQQADVTAAAQREPAWCWNAMTRRRSPDVEMTERRCEFRTAGGHDVFAELLSGVSAEAGQPD